MTTPNSDGPDISHHNPVTNWDAIPQYRLFIAKATEGRTFRSPTFDENWRQMRRRGFEFRGAYHWIRSDSPMLDQVLNLERAIEAHGGLRPGEFVMLDWETTPNIRPVTVAEVELWLTLAQRRWPGRIVVYCSDWVPGFVEWRQRHPGYPIVYANYNTGSKPTGGWAECSKYGAAIWQWTSSRPVPGIADPTVDMNHVFDWGTLTRVTASDQLAGGLDMLHPINPYRNSDTRAYGPAGLAANRPYEFGLDPSKIPANAVAVALNVAMLPTGGAAGFMTVWPGGQPQPNTSVCNAESGGAHNGATIVACPGGKFNVLVSTPAQVIVDVTAYWA